MIEQLGQTDFESRLNQTYRIALPEDSIELRLEEVRTLDSHSDEHECFSLLFSGPRDRLLPQQTYPIEHHHMGAFDLFLVPVAREDQQKWYYEAIINRKKIG